MVINQAMAVAVILVLGLTAKSALASDWFMAEHCDASWGDCDIYKKCPKAQMSPAQVYENNKANGAKIAEKPGERVDVMVTEGGKWLSIYFRTAESCQRFIEEELAIEAQRRKQEEEKLSKFR